MPAGIVDPPLLPFDSSRPFARFDLRLSVSPTFSLRHWLSGSSPSALAAESNSRKTSDSRFGKGSSSSPFPIPRSIAHPVLPPLDCSLPVNRLPRLPIAKYKTVLLHPSGSSPCGLAQPMSPHCTHPLCSAGFHGFIATTECSAPWRRVRTLALVVHATCGFSVCIGTEGSHVPNNRLTRDQATYMPDTVPPVNRFRRNLSRSLLTNHGFDIV